MEDLEGSKLIAIINTVDFKQELLTNLGFLLGLLGTSPLVRGTRFKNYVRSRKEGQPQ